MLYQSAIEMIGKTPLLRLNGIERECGLKAELYGKIEALNPAGSIKDRIALSMILDAEEKGLLHKGDTIIEPTSGNTGIGLASVGASRGYHVILTMPESMSIERRKLLQAYGAEIVLTPAKEGMQGSVNKAAELQKTMQNSIILGQFENPANPKIHYRTTGPELFEDLNGEVDFFVAGIGTGGTISGVGAYLKEKLGNKVKVIGVEPLSSPLLTQGKAGPHKIQGIGANFVPNTLNRDVIDEIIPIEDEEAFLYGKMMAKQEGILVGISSGAALAAAIKLAKEEENQGKRIVALLPDSGDRYLSTPLFEN